MRSSRTLGPFVNFLAVYSISSPKSARCSPCQAASVPPELRCRVFCSSKGQSQRPDQIPAAEPDPAAQRGQRSSLPAQAGLGASIALVRVRPAWAVAPGQPASLGRAIPGGARWSPSSQWSPSSRSSPGNATRAPRPLCPPRAPQAARSPPHAPCRWGSGPCHR